jgi:hypothetical protein
MYKQESSLNQLERLKLIISEFIALDFQRTGSIECEYFKKVLFTLGPSLLNEPNEDKLDQLVNECFDRFRDSIDQNICYIDFWALVLAGLLQNDGAYEFNTYSISYFMQTIRRGIEFEQASFIMEYVGISQSPVQTHNLWVSLPAGHGLLSLTKEIDYSIPPSIGLSSRVYGIPKDGFWKPDTNPSSEEPGMLTVKTLDYKPQIAPNTPHMDHSKSMAKIELAAPEPFITECDREIINL